MDFTGQYQYGAGHQAYTFLPVQPLTPSHSASGAASDDFGHTSPPVRLSQSSISLNDIT